MMKTYLMVVLHLGHHSLPHHRLRQGPRVLQLLQHRAKEKTYFILPTGRNPKKQKIVQKKIGPKKKLAYEMTYEEAKEHSCQAVKDHFIPKVPEKRVQIDALLAAKHYRRKKGKTTLRL
jgi:hypothetical protein